MVFLNGLCVWRAKRDESSNLLSISPKLRLRRKNCLAHSASLGSHEVQDLLLLLDVGTGGASGPVSWAALYLPSLAQVQEPPGDRCADPPTDLGLVQEGGQS